MGQGPEKLGIVSICVVSKRPEKDASDHRSCRPMCLLSILGKILEKHILMSINALSDHEEYSSKLQFGFKLRKSTKDALYLLCSLVSSSAERYTIAMLVDTSVDFDNIR